MFKKTVVFSAVVALMLLGLFVDPSAAQQNNNVTKVDKRGSFLVFPLIKTGALGAVDDTIIKIGNDSGLAVTVKCYWMDNNQTTYDLEFPLTGYQAAWFSAKTGVGSKSVNQFGENQRGELKCWAIDTTPDPNNLDKLEQLKSHNFLYGSAMITNAALIEAYEYLAWAFNVNGPIANPEGPLNLNGLEYDFCPSYLVYNFFSEGGKIDNKVDPVTNVGVSNLALAPCQQDVRTEANQPTCAKAKFDIWNENEYKWTGAYQCVKCYYEGVLSEAGDWYWNNCDLKNLANGKCLKNGKGGDFFTYKYLHTNLGRFRVSPEVFNACRSVFSKVDQDGRTKKDVCADADGTYTLGTNVYRTPFLGVLVTQLAPGHALPADAMMATTGTGAGAFNGTTGHGSPQVICDPAQLLGAVKR